MLFFILRHHLTHQCPEVFKNSTFSSCRCNTFECVINQTMVSFRFLARMTCLLSWQVLKWFPGLYHNKYKNIIGIKFVVSLS